MKNSSWIIVTFSIIIALVCTPIYGKDNLKPLSDYLDYIIENKVDFNAKKENQINSLKGLLSKKGISQEYVYEVNAKISEEYKKYNVDSAVHYAIKNVDLAKSCDNKYWRDQSLILLANVLSYSSRSIESANILSNIDTQTISKDLLADYYETRLRFYEHYAATSNQKSYYSVVENYRDSLLTVLDPSSFKYKSNELHRYILKGEIHKADMLLSDMLRTVDLDSPEYALVTHYIGLIRGYQDLREEEKQYFIMSAIADIKNAIKENASCQRLAIIYYDKGDLARAFKYSQAAIEDALFSGVQFRTAQMSKFYSIINASYQQKEAQTNKELRQYLILISLLVICLTFLAIYIYKQMKKLANIKEELLQSNEKKKELINILNTTNNTLNNNNNLLYESNIVKEQYIAQFFHQCSSYIDMLEDYRTSLYKLAINKKYDELIKNLKSNLSIETEIEGLYSHFDTIFLGLYPTFIEDFNSLLIESEQITLKSEGILNRELRIYALLRLGITDGTLVSNFLRCSLSTVYNYKSMIRNKAAIDKNNFEDMVLKIGFRINNE